MAKGQGFFSPTKDRLKEISVGLKLERRNLRDDWGEGGTLKYPASQQQPDTCCGKIAQATRAILLANTGQTWKENSNVRNFKRRENSSGIQNKARLLKISVEILNLNSDIL